MTTPGQTAPDGSFQMGSGPFEQWGQNLTETAVRALGVPGVNPADPLGSLADLLMRLPLEALQFFQNFITDAIEGTWNTVTGAVNNILGWLVPREVMVALEEFQAFLATLLTNPGSVIGTITQDMVDGLEGFISNLQTLGTNFASLATNLLTNPGAVLGDITQGMVTGLTDAIAGLDDFIQNVVDGIITAIRGIPFVGGTIADAIQALTGYREDTTTSIINNQNFQISTITGSAYRNPSWVCRYPTADVTYPEVMHSTTKLFGTAGNASTGTAHTHDLATGNGITAIPDREVVPDGRRGGYITVSTGTIFDTVALYAGHATGSVDNVFVEVFREASDQSLTLVSSTDVSASLTAVGGTDYLEVPLSAAIIAQPGERYMVSLRNSTSTGISAYVKALDTDLDTITFLVTGADADNSTYTTVQAAAAWAATRLLPWAMLAAKNLAQADQSFSDDANRASIGPLWVQFSNTGANHIDLTGNRFAFQGATTGYQGALYARRLSSDSNRVEADLHIITAGVGTHPREGIMLHCDRDVTQQVLLAVNDSGAVLYTGPPGSLTSRATHATGGSGHWALYYDIPTNTYLVEKDGVLTGLEWEDASDIIEHGEDYRFGGIRIDRAVVDFLNTHNGGEIDNWTLRDFVAA